MAAAAPLVGPTQATARPAHQPSSVSVAPAAARQCQPRWVVAQAVAPATAAPGAEAPTTTPYQQLASLAGARGCVGVGRTAWGGRGLLATDSQPARSSLLSVPLVNALIIADEPTSSISVFSDRAHTAWQEVHGALPEPLLEFLQGDARWDARMAAWLLWVAQQQQQHGSQLWRSYIALLPREQEMSCLLNFSAAEAAELQLPDLVTEARVQADWNTHLYRKHYDARSGSLAALGLSASLADSLWALSLVRSRTFSEDVNGEGLTLMVPFADLANHCSSHNATFCLGTGENRQRFELRSMQDLSAGEEVTISYGDAKPNSDLLRDYGFTLPGNEHDRIKFGSSSSSASSGSSGSSNGSSSGSSSSDADQLPGLNPACLLEAAGFTGDLTISEVQAAAAAQQQCDQLQLSRRKAALLSMPLRSSNGGGAGGFSAWLAAATKPWTESGRAPPQPLRSDQVGSERAAVQQLLACVKQQLAALPTSIATDQQLLRDAAAAGQTVSSSSSSTTGRVRAAIEARVEHKLLLQEAAAVLQQYQAYLAGKFS